MTSSPSDVVWAQGGVLHVGGDQADLSPVDIDAFVVVHGGVFVLADGELWFTDLARLRGTGQTEVTGVQVSGDASRLNVVDTRGGTEETQGYDTRTGKAVRGEVDTQTPEQKRRGTGPVRGDDVRRRRAVRRRGRHRRPRAARRERRTTSGWAAGPGTRSSSAWARLRLVGPATSSGATSAAGTCRLLDRVGPGPVVFGTGR